MLLKEKYQGRAHFETDRHKKMLFEIGITLLETKAAKHGHDEFSTILIFNYPSITFDNSLYLQETNSMTLHQSDILEIYDIQAVTQVNPSFDIGLSNF